MRSGVCSCRSALYRTASGEAHPCPRASSKEGGASMRHLKIGAILLSVVMLVGGLWAVPLALGQEQPRRGGILRVALAPDPPSRAAHQEQPLAVTQPMSAVYNNLLVIDPHNYPKVIGDVAKSWKVSGDH